MIDGRDVRDDWLAAETDIRTLARGRAYVREGRVDLQEARTEGDGRLELVGSCRGRERARYRQHVQIAERRGSLHLLGTCTCPVGFNCKHVAALVLTWREGWREAEGSQDAIDSWLEGLTRSDDGEQEGREGVLYLLEPGGAPGSPFIVRFMVARRRQTGGWARVRSTHLSTMSSVDYRGSYLRPVDMEIVGYLGIARRDGWRTDPQLLGAPGAIAFDHMVATGRLFLGSEPDRPLRRAAERPLTIGWTETSDGYRPGFEVEGGGQALLDVVPPRYVDGERREAGALAVPAGLTGRQLTWLRRAPPIEAKRIAEVSHRLALAAPAVPTPAPLAFDVERGPPRPCLAVAFDPSEPERARVQLTFRYGGVVLSAGGRSDVVVGELGSRLVKVHRDRGAEARAEERLTTSGLTADGASAFTIPASDARGRDLRHRWLHWWAHEVPRLEAEGWLVQRDVPPSFMLSEATGLTGDVAQDAGEWFTLRFDLEVGGERIALLPLVSELLETYRPGALPEQLYLDAGGGRFVGVPARLLEPVLTTILELHDRRAGDELRLARPDAPRLLDLEHVPIRGATSLQRLARQLADFSGLKPVPPPSTFRGELRPYQQQGLDWLQFLRACGFNGILADDMGLGKTIQTLAHLAVERRAGRMRHPSLIVAPTSLLTNWRREAEQFTPKLSVLVLHGPQRAAFFDRLDAFNVVLTTYPLLPRDHAALLAQRWHYLILDEAQQIKNPKAQAAQVVRRIDCAHRLCLTGTPMENHLGELWAQFDFLMPGFLGDRAAFTRHYRTPVEKEGDREPLQRLMRRTKPFLLRRTKDRVASELPPKSEFLRTATLGPRQARLYESIRLTMEQRVRRAIAARGLARSHVVVLDALLKLRQVCCDPRLLPRGTTGARGAGSAKFDLLFELLPEMLEEGRRVLLFSQFTTMLGLIEREVAARGFAYSKLTGQTRKREAAIDRFRTGDVDLFLISLKAGGVGLNLVEADTVIHYDPWWNPAVENQATDRAHRIGQERPVFVYKLVAEGTVEEKILALQARKQALADATYGRSRGDDQAPVDEETIRDLLAAL